MDHSPRGTKIVLIVYAVDTGNNLQSDGGHGGLPGLNADLYKTGSLAEQSKNRDTRI